MKADIITIGNLAEANRHYSEALDYLNQIIQHVELDDRHLSLLNKAQESIRLAVKSQRDALAYR